MSGAELADLQEQIRKLQDTLSGLQQSEADDGEPADSPEAGDAASTSPDASPARSKSARRRERRRRAAEAAAKPVDGEPTAAVADPPGEAGPERDADPDPQSDVDVAAATGSHSEELDEAGPPDVQTDDALNRPGARLRTLAGRAVPGSRRGRILVAIGAAAVIAAGVTVPLVLSGGGGLPANVVFAVNGHEVTSDRLEAEVRTLEALYGIKAPTGGQELDKFRRDTAQAYAVSYILADAEAKQNIVIADKAASDVLAKYVTQQFGDGSSAYDTFVQALGSVGTTAAAVTDEIKRQLALSQLYDKVTANVTASEAEVQAAFTKDPSAYATPEKRTISNIVVATQAQAQAAVQAIRSGTPFATEAADVSIDTSTKTNGGSLGSVAATDLDSGYAKVAFAAAQGQVFGPVQTQSGWNVGVVTGVTPSVPATFSAVKATVKQNVLLAKELSTWRSWLAAQIRAAHVQYASAYRPADPDAVPSGSTSQLVSPSGSGSSGSGTSPSTATSGSGTGGG